MLRHGNRRHRPTSAFLAAVVTLGGLAATGCTPGPSPTPTPTALFSSEAEAFAAAEETYRAYVDATNRSRAGDETADPLSYLVGKALERDVSAERLQRTQGLSIVGEIVASTFQGRSASLTRPVAVVADVCVDVSGTGVTDKEGTDKTPASRKPRLLLTVTMIEGSHTSLVISQSDLASESC